MLIIATIGLILLWSFISVMLTPECNPQYVACMNNAIFYGIALHHYHYTHDCFPPPCVLDDNGRPMHSWRAFIMPYIEGENPIKNYDFDEPWDGTNNKKLTDAPDADIHCPSSCSKLDSRRDYVTITGPGTIWPGGNGTRLEDIADGPDNTVLLVEMDNSDIRWLEPRDITIEEALGNSNDGTATIPTSGHYTLKTYFTKSLPLAGNILMADSSVHCFENRPSSEDLAAILSIDGGEPVKIEDMVEKYKYPLYKRLRWDHVIGLPLFLITLVWLWVWIVEEPYKVKTDQVEK